MSKSSFVLTLKLNAEKYQKDILNKRLDIGRQIYNACLMSFIKDIGICCKVKFIKKH
ncbi:MAG: hypothetical protein U9N10_06840 [Bacillota bacterium]|nr:hypothetical protein [Bacillota bacterium]